MKTGRMTWDEDALVVDLAERGFSIGRIAEKLNRHRATINWAFYRLGLKKSLSPRQVQYRRGNSVVKSFTPDEDTFIQVLRDQSYPPAKIADLTTKRFGHKRSQHTIRMRLVMLEIVETKEAVA